MTVPLTENELEAQIRMMEISYAGEGVSYRRIVISDMQEGQIIVFDEPAPIQIDEQLMEKVIKDSFMLWVHSNVLELS
ncbi:hypothetical protein HAX54_024744 [Datura stramonium]|uniref:Uncharacterized protein n=1 Tax=Datura stramonium TaxID=4076 RepID=A0ABS8RKP2_DATST|nr:hypothetical protein [Datura stramonium]